MIPSVRTHAVPRSSLSLPCPNGLRLSGDGGEAAGVRCSRGLGDPRLLVMIAPLLMSLAPNGTRQKSVECLLKLEYVPQLVL